MFPLRLFFILLFILIPRVFAQNPDQTLSDSGVLVSGNNTSSAVIGLADRDDPIDPGNQQERQSVVNSDDASNSSTDPIIMKSTDAVMFQITANMKLSQDQIKTIQPIIMKYIVKVRDLQQSLGKGDIDGKTMYGQREQLYKDEDRELSRIFTSDQMNIWANIQNP